ncbi:cytochrome c oxidase accessory protein CcoG [Marinimicrobium sp. ARAG 43.8]|uniref:cytochrome c oxidase accessory protein CcoG n=1 Tax=Marinimicrobium sp. ARAG 43.8 TaxID=3418719 RepID=UPI003CEEC027
MTKSNQPDEERDTGIRYVNLYEADNKVYMRRVKGFYQRLRRYTGIPLLAAFALMPWLVIDGRPAMLFDLSERRFHILWLSFGPQDGMFLAWLLIIAAFLLFTVTVLVGRVWCGFTCPQTVWTQMFVWAEFQCEGDRNKRIKLDAQPWGPEKIVRKGTKHFLWLLIAALTAITFVGYFYPVRELIVALVTLDIHPAAAFWVFFFTAATYMNAGFMREQVCKYMCPYARFQSVMYDKDTLTVFYNYRRGEPRGPRKPNEDVQEKGLGDCIDCSWCVQVCPVDIDIRDGLQPDCIDCGLCVDACNTVMDRMNYPRGLISFTTEDAIEKGKTQVFRPRLLAYGAVLLVMIGVFAYALTTRQPVGLDVLRDRGTRMYRISGPEVENVYTLKINNKDRETHIYDVTVSGDYPFELEGYRPLPVEEGEILTIPVRVAVPRSDLDTVKAAITLRVQAREKPEIFTEHSTTFIGPTLRGQ